MQNTPNLRIKISSELNFHACSSSFFIKELIEMHSETRFTDMNLREDQRRPTYNRLGYRYGFMDDNQEHQYFYYFLERALGRELFGSKRSYSIQEATVTLIRHGLLLVQNDSVLTPTPFNAETGKPAYCYAVSSEILNYGSQLFETTPFTPIQTTPLINEV